MQSPRCFFPDGTMNAAITTTTVLYKVTPAAPLFGQAVTLVALVSPASSQGFVSFLDRGVLVGTGAVDGFGLAEVTTLTLSAGPHELVAAYAGNTSAAYSASQSAALSYIVTAVPGASLGTAVNFGAGNTPGSVAVGDFNGDGIADLAVADFYGGVRVLLGKGDGTFQPAVNYGAGSQPYSVAWGFQR